MNTQKPGYGINKPQDAKVNKRKGRKSRTLMMIFIIIIVGITALCVALTMMMSYYSSQKSENKGNTIIFYEADYDADIMQNSEYLGLNRSIMFENPETGIATEIVDGDLYDVPSTFRGSVALILDFVNFAINGKTDDLNALFSNEYIEADGKLKMDFTMQQLYNIKIIYVTTTNTESNGETFVSYDYWLEYMIHKNNGTFRNDMGSDCVRKEYVRVTDRNGKMGIDVLAPYVTTEIVPENSLTVGKIASMVGVSFIIITVFAVICLMVSKLKRKIK